MEAGGENRHHRTDHRPRDDHRQVDPDALTAEIHDPPDGFGPGTVGQQVAERAPERRQQLGLVGAAGRGIAQDDENQDGQPDSEDTEHHLEGHRHRSGGEHQHCAERPQRDEMTGESAEHRVDDDCAAQPGQHRVGHQGPQPEDRPASGGGPRSR